MLYTHLPVLPRDGSRSKRSDRPPIHIESKHDMRTDRFATPCFLCWLFGMVVNQKKKKKKKSESCTYGTDTSTGRNRANTTSFPTPFFNGYSYSCSCPSLRRGERTGHVSQARQMDSVTTCSDENQSGTPNTHKTQLHTNPYTMLVFVF